MNSPLIVTGKPLEKLITVISQGIGILYEPTRIRKKADADAYRLERMGEAKALGLIKDAETKLNIFERAQARERIEKIEQQTNLETIAARSLNYLKETANSVEVDPTWRSRFFSSAKSVYHKELQEVWAKILAEEVCSPGRISLRTLDILSNLTAKEGKLFEIFASLCFDHVGLYHPFDREIYQSFGLNYANIQLLRSAGLVHDNDDIISPLKYFEKINGCLISSGNTIYVISNGSTNGFKFNVIPLTEEGLELMGMISTGKNMQYFYKFMAECKISRKLNFRVATEEEVASFVAAGL